MKTGEIEISADDVKVLNRCNVTLPFHIHDFHEVDLSLINNNNKIIIIIIIIDREHLFLFQRISVAVQRFNAVLLHDSFPTEDHPD